MADVLSPLYLLPSQLRPLLPASLGLDVRYSADRRVKARDGNRLSIRTSDID